MIIVIIIYCWCCCFHFVVDYLHRASCVCVCRFGCCLRFAVSVCRASNNLVILSDGAPWQKKVHVNLIDVRRLSLCLSLSLSLASTWTVICGQQKIEEEEVETLKFFGGSLFCTSWACVHCQFFFRRCVEFAFPFRIVRLGVFSLASSSLFSSWAATFCALFLIRFFASHLLNTFRLSSFFAMLTPVFFFSSSEWLSYLRVLNERSVFFISHFWLHFQWFPYFVFIFFIQLMCFLLLTIFRQRTKQGL